MSNQSEIKPLTSLRGLAALWVLLHHVTTIEGTKAALSPDGFFMQFADKGWFGVDIFFILSGYILTRTYFYKKIPRKLFYARRVARIYPLYIASIAVLGVMVAAATAFHLPLNHPENYSLKSLVFSVLMLQAVLFPEPQWNFVSWSLSFEMVCYLVLPLAMVHLRGKTWAQNISILLVMLSLYIVTSVLYEHPTYQIPGLVRSAAAFFCGVLGFLTAEHNRLPVPAYLAEFVFLMFVVTVIWADSAIYLFPLAVIAIPAVADSSGPAAKLMSATVLVRLGTISYSVYLLQTPVYYVVNKAFPVSLAHSEFLAKVAMIAVFVALVVAVAEISYRVIEAPSRRWLTERFTRRLGGYALNP